MGNNCCDFCLPAKVAGGKKQRARRVRLRGRLYKTFCQNSRCQILMGFLEASWSACPARFCSWRTWPGIGVLCWSWSAICAAGATITLTWNQVQSKNSSRMLAGIAIAAAQDYSIQSVGLAVILWTGASSAFSVVNSILSFWLLTMLLHVDTTWAASFCVVLATVAPWPQEQRPVPARAFALKLTARLRAFCLRQVRKGRPSEPCVVGDFYRLCNLALCCVWFWTSLFHQVWPQQWHANATSTCVVCSLVLYAWPLPLPLAAWMAMVCPLFGKSDYPKGYLEKKASNKTARLVWKTKNQEAANVLQVFGFRAGPDGVIRLVLKYLPEKDAQKHFANLAQALQAAGSWEDVVQSVMEHLLEHTFIQPKIEIHAQDPGQARIHWQQRGLTIITYKTVLKSLNVDGDKGHLVSAFVPKAIAESKLVEL